MRTWEPIDVGTEGTLVCDFRHRNELHVGRLYDLPDCSLLLCRAGARPVLGGNRYCPGSSDRGGQGARSCCKKAEAPRKSSPTRLVSNHEEPGPDEDRDRRTLAQQSLAFEYRSVLPSLQHDSQIPGERSIYRDCDLRRTHARYPHFQGGLRGRSARLETLERHDLSPAFDSFSAPPREKPSHRPHRKRRFYLTWNTPC
jgi:hypothetical protein